MKRFILPLTAVGLIELIDREKRLFPIDNKPTILYKDTFNVCYDIETYQNRAFRSVSALVVPEKVLIDASQRTGINYQPVIFLVDDKVLASVSFIYSYPTSKKIIYDVLGLDFYSCATLNPDFDIRV